MLPEIDLVKLGFVFVCLEEMSELSNEHDRNEKYKKTSFVFLFVGGMILLVSMAIDGITMRIQRPPYSSIPELPLIFWSAFLLTVVGVSLYFLCQSRRNDWVHLFVGILVVLLFYGYLPISQGTLRYMDSWYHSMTANYIVQDGSLNGLDVGYHSWPGFFLWYASLRMITGLDFPLLGKFTATIINVVFFVWLFLFYRKLSARSGVTALLALVTFAVTNDRFVSHIAPISFAYAMLVAFLYGGFLECNDRRLWAICQVFLFVAVISHPLSVTWVFLAMVILFLIVNWLGDSRLLRMYRLSTSLVLGVVFWISWSTYWVAEYWWRFAGANFREVIERSLAYEVPVSYQLSYWRWSPNPPLEIQFWTVTVQVAVLCLALLSVLKISRYYGLFELRRKGLKIGVALNLGKHKLHGESLPFLILLALLAGVLTGGLIPFFVSPGILAERLLLFFWAPISFFACRYILGLPNRTLRRLLIVGIILSLIPSFLMIHWPEFHFVTHEWETKTFEFSASYAISGSTVLTDQETGFMLRYFCGNLEILSDYSRAWTVWHSRYGLLARAPPIIDIFIGRTSPLSSTWMYFLRSERQESRVALIYGFASTELEKVDAFLNNSPVTNKIYGNGHAMIFYRCGV